MSIAPRALIVVSELRGSSIANFRLRADPIQHARWQKSY